MAKRSSIRTLSDAFQRSRPQGSKPARVSLIMGGVKYKPGQAPAQVCPPKANARKAFATPL